MRKLRPGTDQGLRTRQMDRNPECHPQGTEPLLRGFPADRPHRAGRHRRDARGAGPLYDLHPGRGDRGPAIDAQQDLWRHRCDHLQAREGRPRDHQRALCGFAGRQGGPGLRRRDLGNRRHFRGWAGDQGMQRPDEGKARHDGPLQGEETALRRHRGGERHA